jgi:tRNA(Ile2) C34 agmatinyltransferase TiaS
MRKCEVCGIEKASWFVQGMSLCAECADVQRCPTCEGVGIGLGHLGALDWFRCRDCGSEFSVTAVPAVV